MCSLHTRPASPLHSQNNEDVKRNLQQQARGCQYLVLWLDCDREGENIAFEVSRAVVVGAQLGSSRRRRSIWRVYRMWPNVPHHLQRKAIFTWASRRCWVPERRSWMSAWRPTATCGSAEHASQVRQPSDLAGDAGLPTSGPLPLALYITSCFSASYLA